MPTRKIPLSYRGHVTGRQSLAPGMESVWHESALERDFVTLSRFDPTVLSVEHQPVTFRWRGADGRRRRYTPDYRVVRVTGVDLVEVKHRADLKAEWDALRPAFEVARKWAMPQGIRFRIVTESAIRTPRLENAKRLLPRAGDQIDCTVARKVTDALSSGRAMPFSKLVDAVSGASTPKAVVLGAVWAMIANKTLSADMDKPIDGNTPLTLSEGV